jgi:hypothetical protein
MNADKNSLMRLKKITGRSLPTILHAVLVIALLITPTLKTRAHSPASLRSETGMKQQSGGAQTTAPPLQLSITVSNQGMTPASATVSSGMVHLMVENRSGQENLLLRVSRESGELVREISVTGKGQESATELELSAGQYALTETSNAAWTCRITAQSPPGGSVGAAPHP